MKKSLLIIAALLLVSGWAMADAFYGTTGTPAAHSVTINVTIPPRIGIDIVAGQHIMALTLVGDAGYPPSADSAWTIGTNLISILSTGTYAYDYTTANVSLLAGLAVGDFEWQRNGGWGAAGWTDFGSGNLEPSGTARTGGWIGRNMDYRVWLGGNETASVLPQAVLITYTISAP